MFGRIVQKTVHGPFHRGPLAPCVVSGSCKGRLCAFHSLPRISCLFICLCCSAFPGLTCSITTAAWCNSLLLNAFPHSPLAFGSIFFWVQLLGLSFWGHCVWLHSAFFCALSAWIVVRLHLASRMFVCQLLQLGTSYYLSPLVYWSFFCLSCWLAHSLLITFIFATLAAFILCGPSLVAS